MIVLEMVLLCIAPLVVILVWKYDKRSSRTNISVFLAAIIMALVANIFAYPLNWVLPIWSGTLGLILGYVASILIFGYLLHKYFKLTWLSLIFASLLPLTFTVFYVEIESWIKSRLPKVQLTKEEKEFATLSLKRQRSFLELSLESYKRICGEYPENLSSLFEKSDKCIQWEKNPYGGKEITKDFSGKDLKYKTDKKNYYELTYPDIEGHGEQTHRYPHGH